MAQPGLGGLDITALADRSNRGDQFQAADGYADPLGAGRKKRRPGSVTGARTSFGDQYGDRYTAARRAGYNAAGEHPDDPSTRVDPTGHSRRYLPAARESFQTGLGQSYGGPAQYEQRYRDALSDEAQNTFYRNQPVRGSRIYSYQ